jgi:hypothetical protein
MNTIQVCSVATLRDWNFVLRNFRVQTAGTSERSAANKRALATTIESYDAEQMVPNNPFGCQHLWPRPHCPVSRVQFRNDLPSILDVQAVDFGCLFGSDSLLNMMKMPSCVAASERT